MMTTIDQFTEVLNAESDIADAMLRTLFDQQQAIIRFRNDTLMMTVERQRQLIAPMEALEHEREELCRAFDSTTRRNGGDHFSLSTFAQSVPENSATRLLDVGRRLKAKVEKIIQVNHQNKMLLDNSLRFVRHSLRIMTDNYAKRLIDTRL